MNFHDTLLYPCFWSLLNPNFHYHLKSFSISVTVEFHKSRQKQLKTRNPQTNLNRNCNDFMYSSSVWSEQINEIDKLPDWLKLNHSSNPLSQVGYKILGMNTVQLRGWKFRFYVILKKASVFYLFTILTFSSKHSR